MRKRDWLQFFNRDLDKLKAKYAEMKAEIEDAKRELDELNEAIEDIEDEMKEEGE